MKNKKIAPKELGLLIMGLKVLTLMHHLTKDEVKKYYGCDFEFDVDGQTNVPSTLHVWIGKNHNYQEKHHKVFSVPKHLQKPLY